MNPTRIVTYALGVLTAIAAALLWTKAPTIAQALLTAAAGILGFATTHPADAANLKAANAAALNAATGAVPTEEITPVTKPVPRIGGDYGSKVGMLLVLAGSLLAASTALAQTPPSPQFGGCFAQGQVCLGPSASITLGELNLATSKFSGGIIPGVGYGVTYAQSEWYATGLALYFSFKAGQDGPNQAIPSLVLSFANYVRVGTGVAITETDGPVQTQWLLLFGLGSDFGGSPKYTQAQQQKALAAQREGVK